MAATTIRDLLVKLGVEANTLAVQRFDAALNIAKRTMLLAAGAATVLTGAILGATVATAKQGDEAAKMGARVGVTAEEMQELGFAAEQTGATIANVETALKRQARAALEASEGTAEYADSFRALGITDPSQLLQGQIGLFEDLADGIKDLPTDLERTARAQEIFGRAGANLVPLLKLGAEGIREMRREAQELGFVLSEEDAKAAEEFTDAMNRARLVVVAIRNQIGKALIPTLTEMLNGFRDFVLVNRQIIRVRIDRFMMRIRQAVDFARAAFERINRVVVDELGGWDAIFQQIEKAAKLSGAIVSLGILINVLRVVRLTVLGIQAALLANPIGLVFIVAAAAVVLLGLAIDDLIVFANGGNSAIGSFLEAMNPELAEEFRTTLLDVRDVLRDLASLTADTLQPIFAALGIEVETLGDIFSFVFGQVILAEVERLNSMLQGLVEILRRIPGFVTAFTGRGVEDLINPPPITRRNRGTLFDTLGGGGGGLAGIGQQALGTPAPAAAGGGGATTVINQGDTNFNGMGMSVEEAEALSARDRAARNRQAIDATRGGER